MKPTTTTTPQDYTADEEPLKIRQSKKKSVLLNIIGRLLWLPGLLAHARRRKTAPVFNGKKVRISLELRLFSQMFPTGFLHYGYFSDPLINGEEISLADLDKAQLAYSEKLISLIRDKTSPVLDVGCGMGGISSLLHDRGYEVVALTPDHHQATYVQNHIPDIQVLETTLEKLSADDYAGHFGTVLTSESLQYLNLDKSLPMIRRLLKPGGVWIACDYFCLNEEDVTSGHTWKDFCEILPAHGFRIVQQEDITANVLPTLKFAHVFANRFVMPACDFAESKTRSKHPGIHYIFGSLFDVMDEKLERGARSLDPERFMDRKRYMKLVIEPVADN